MGEMSKEKLIQIIKSFDHDQVKYIAVQVKVNKKVWFYDVEFDVHTRNGFYLLCRDGKPLREYKVRSLCVFLETFTRDHPVYVKCVDVHPFEVYKLSDRYEVEGDELVLFSVGINSEER